MTAEENRRGAASHLSAVDANARQEKLDALARLSGGMAHDFNNILHVIKSATELLRRKLGTTDEETAEVLEMLQRNANRGTRLTRELLAFAGRQPLNPVTLNANRLIAGMQDRLRDALGRGVSVDTSLEGSLWQICADAAELETAILNLASNARDAMRGTGKVVIETANVKLDHPRDEIEAGEYVTVTVRDAGPGMTPEVRARAFDPYFTTKDAGSMTGLGLSRVYGFVRQANGHISIASLPGGTTVTLYLPRRSQPVVEAPATPNVVAIDTASGRRAKSLAGLRILVVEDESLIGMLAEDLLEQLGCRMVGLVSSLGKALDMAKRTDIDFALLDVDINGERVYPVAAALQARGVPFVFMSGYGGLDGPWSGRRVVQKPFDLEQLRREIEQAITNT